MKSNDLNALLLGVNAALVVALSGCGYTDQEVNQAMRDCRGALSISCVDVALAYANQQREIKLQATIANQQDIVAVLGQDKYDEMISVMKQGEQFIEDARPNFFVRNFYPMGDGTSYMLAFSSFDGDARIAELESEYARAKVTGSPQSEETYSSDQTGYPPTDSGNGEVGLHTDVSDLPDGSSSTTTAENGGQPSAQRIEPSFDCDRASTAVEKLICSDPGLADLDKKLSEAYRQFLNASSDKAAAKRGQVDWLRGQRNPCQTVACVQTAYQDRLTTINGDIPAAAQ